MEKKDESGSSKIIVVSSFLILGLSDVWAKKQEVTPKALRAPVSMRSEYQGNIYKIKLDKNYTPP